MCLQGGPLNHIKKGPAQFFSVCAAELTSCVNTAKFPDSSMSSISSFVVDLPAENTKQQQHYYQIYTCTSQI